VSTTQKEDIASVGMNNPFRISRIQDSFKLMFYVLRICYYFVVMLISKP
jgi:hypothetical protein